MSAISEILQKLDGVEFHDQHIERISFKTENGTELQIDLALWHEEEDYRYWTLKFTNVLELSWKDFALTSRSDMECNSFEYHYDDIFECKIVVLLSRDGGAFDITLSCEMIKFLETGESKV